MSSDDAMDIERDALLREIKQAFKDVDRKGGTSLHQAVAADDYMTPEQQFGARARDRDRHWLDIPHAEIAAHHWVFIFFNDICWRYHLPAYMTWALLCDREMESDSRRRLRRRTAAGDGEQGDSLLLGPFCGRLRRQHTGKLMHSCI
ncbi:MAG: hypothetical protein NTW19_12515 [Planctomycetota bacterium]|nr:hypothetical protein [Planctomycetota bacterium]